MVKQTDNLIKITTDRATLDDKGEIEAMLNSLCAEGQTLILIDLGQTTYLPSELMGLLMWKKKELKVKNITIKIVRISESLYRIFTTAMVTDFFELDGSEVIKAAGY